MGNPKRPKLALTGASDRQHARVPVAIPAICVIGDREEEEVLVTDLGRNGCCMYTSAVGVTKTEPITIQLEGDLSINGTLKWNKAGSIGVRFDQALPDELLEKLRDDVSAHNVVAMRN